MTNNASNGLILLITFVFILQGCSSRTAPAPVVNLKTLQHTSTVKLPKHKSHYHTVKKGDTLYSIAFSSGKDFVELAKINRVSAPYHIYPGQQLNLNASSSRPPAATQKPKHSPAQRPIAKPKKAKPKKAKPKKAKPEKNKPKKVTPRKDTVAKNRTEQSGFPPQVQRWYWPTNGNIVSKFSLAPEGNKGIDIAGKKGSPITAAADGKVVYTGSALRGYGKLIIVKHSDAYLSAYAHNDKIMVKEQQWVKAGQKIGHMGKTGSENFKLHFEIRYKGKSVDPLRYLSPK